MSEFFPVLSACWPGLLTALSPCSLTASLIAVGYISGSSRHWPTVLRTAAAYAAGVALVYFLLARLVPLCVHAHSCVLLPLAYASVRGIEVVLRRSTGLIFLIAGLYYTVTHLLV